MDVLWLLIGFVAGVILTWLFFNIRFKRQTRTHEAELQRECGRVQEIADRERDAHQYTIKRLSALETEHATAAEQTETLASDLRACGERLDTERSGHLQTRQRLSQAEADNAAAIERADSLQADLEAAQQKLESYESTGTQDSEQLSQLQAANENLESRLNEEQTSRGRFETQLREAQAAISTAGSENQARIGELENSLRERDDRIRQLEAEINGGGSVQEAAPREPESDIPEEPDTPAETSSAPEPVDQAETVQAETVEPAPAAPEGADDDLTKIKGIGPVLKRKLNGLGITTFRQIADFTEADIARVNKTLNFPGRIERENWIDQAKELA